MTNRIPLDDIKKWAPRLDDCASEFLSPAEQAEYRSMTPEDRQEQLVDLLASPIRRFSAVNEAWFRAKWADTLRRLHQGCDLSLLEVATGDADMIPQAMARSHPGSRYVTANMNRALNESLLAKTAGLGLDLRLIEDDAANIGRHFGPETFDVVAFQHGVNDVVQAILCGRAGIDTVYGDWMELLPEMIRLVRREVDDGTLEDHVKGPLLGLLRSQIDALKPGGVVAINHYEFQLDLDWGYPPELFAGYVPLVRRWFKELEGVREFELDGCEPNWWLFLRKL